jgi:hypothetical protein
MRQPEQIQIEMDAAAADIDRLMAEADEATDDERREELGVLLKVAGIHAACLNIELQESIVARAEVVHMEMARRAEELASRVGPLSRVEERDLAETAAITAHEARTALDAARLELRALRQELAARVLTTPPRRRN